MSHGRRPVLVKMVVIVLGTVVRNCLLLHAASSFAVGFSYSLPPSPPPLPASGTLPLLPLPLVRLWILARAGATRLILLRHRRPVVLPSSPRPGRCWPTQLPETKALVALGVGSQQQAQCSQSTGRRILAG